ncbi:MAG TPA: dephospho-CoA kinase [Smithellaceae bacterium]|nr:MAG: Dephospho-CoA kinase [Deltaproteobacteria bacterium ADurb.BinA014]HNZ31891.1 dephospho-CoA kinase [Smithellaceae bacterium]HOF78073.1 dephospho-CoA kinase [Smithellaceae bacterium]HOM69840.1 dephospho-CoA kinase [Smithellaceae bacterium]HOS08517.1 dephospho-CoA kinase [Smithellaceae bacterium]
MLSVGLTGGIACGKSTVADMFVRKGAYLIDFDVLAHEVQKPGRAAWEKVVSYFGDDILLPDKSINRDKLAKIVFYNPEKLNSLNQIVHPYTFLEWHDHLEKISSRNKNAIIIAAIPLLFEVKSQHLFDVTVLVLASREEQLSRLKLRNGLTREDAQKRIDSQMSLEQKKKLADIVIDNENSLLHTEAKVDEVWQKLVSMERDACRVKRV